MAATPPVCDFGWKAPDFELPGVDGTTHRLADLVGPKGIVVMFICNHCPYVRAITDRLTADCAALAEIGVSSVAICSNDAVNYPDDSFENMKLFAKERGFGFPYLQDESQAVAKAYDAVCTPDFFGFNADLELQYRGRLDEGRTAPPPPNARRDLLEAMRQVAETGKGPADQTASMGCSIKWRPGA